MRRFNLLLFVAVVAATTMVSCFKDEVILTPAITQESDVIGFVANVHDDDATRACRNRIGKHDLKSADGEFVLPMGVYVEDGIYGTADADTRGAKISSLNSFKVWGELTQGDGTKVNYIPGVDFGLDLGDENDKKDDNYDSNTIYPWPGEGTLNFVALGNAPASGLTANMNGTAVESFTYTVPADAIAQTDVVVATLNDVLGSANSTQALDFKHIMSAVNVKIGTMPSSGGVIKSMKFKNIYNSGTYNYKTETWLRAGTKADFPVLSNGNASFTPGNTGSIVNAEDYTLMMLPQIIADDAVLEIVFQYSGASEVTLTAPIAKNEQGVYYEWKKGKTTYYTISIDENYNLQVIPQGNVLDAHYIMTTANVNVTKIDEGQEWYLKVSADNVTSTENISVKVNDGTINQYIKDGYWINAIDGNIVNARGRDIVKGEGTGITNVIIFIPENITAQDRKITLEYGIVGQESNAKFEYLYQKCPYWDTTNKWGWEKVDDQNSGQYGFAWTKVICYVTTYDLRSWGAYSQDDVKNMVKSILTSLGLPTTGIDATQSDYDANSFVTIDTYDNKKQALGSWWRSGTRIAVIIDYTKLDFENAMSTSDGLANTKAFFYGASMLAFENALLDVLKNDGSGDKFFRQLNDAEYNSGEFNFHNYTYNGSSAIFRDNGGGVDDASGILKYIIKKNAFDIVTTTTDTYTYTGIDMDANDIDWYLPAKDQYTGYDDFEFATGTATFNPAEFWSSTAAINQKAYPGKGDAIARTETRKVIVQRKVTDVPQAVAVTLDNSEMAGGENGEAQWVE